MALGVELLLAFGPGMRGAVGFQPAVDDSNETAFEEDELDAAVFRLL